MKIFTPIILADIISVYIMLKITIMTIFKQYVNALSVLSSEVSISLLQYWLADCVSFPIKEADTM